MDDIHCKCSTQLIYDVLVCQGCRRPIRFPGIQVLERRVEELEKENDELTAAVTAEVKYTKELQAKLESETKWSKAYCNAFVKVRDAAKTLVDSFGPCSCSVDYTDRGIEDPSCHYHQYQPELNDLKKVLKDTEGI